MSNRAVFITGAGGGIGRALTRTLADRGWTVYAGVRSHDEELEALANVHLVPLDVADTASVVAAAAVIEQAQENLGLQAVVNGAGVIVQGPLELLPDEELHRQFDINVYGPVRVFRAFVPLLRQGRGRLVNIGAISDRVAIPFAAPISASKAALASLSDALRLELKQWQIPVVLVEPGAIATDIFTKAKAAAVVVQAHTAPQQLALYHDALAAMDRAMTKMTASPVQVAVGVLVKALERRRPKARYTAGRDATLVAVLLARLPLRSRDRMVARAFGLHKVPQPAGPVSPTH